MDRRCFLALVGRSSQYLIAGAFLDACGGGSGGDSSATLSDVADAPTAVPPAADPPISPPPTIRQSNLQNIGPLLPPDDNGLRLPAGFTSRVVARSSEDPTNGSGYVWHGAPDGGATFDSSDGGWIYVSNSELSGGAGGVGALRFDAAGRLTDAYPILDGTNRNCAGGRTPWQTWLSCEEVSDGQVWECDPTGRNLPVVRPALGLFTHEAAAVDPTTGQIYLTEDQTNGRLYRFTPATPDSRGSPDLTSGALEVARSQNGAITWLAVPDPSAATTSTRLQVAESTPFDGGEGISHFDGTIHFTTKGDNRVWAYEIASATLSVLYDAANEANPILTGVDNLEVSSFGDLLVAEDGGDMEIVVITRDAVMLPLLQVTGHPSSEITGPAFTPDLNRLYFSSQRGASGDSADGVTYEVTGPFAI